MASSSNPTGYAKPPDFGPLFTNADAVHVQPDHRGAGRGVSPTPARLPRNVDVSARVATGRRQRILQYLVKCGPSTLDEICAVFGVAPNQISGRVSDLKRDNLVAETGLERPSRSGCACQVLEITDAGKEELADMKRRPQ